MVEFFVLTAEQSAHAQTLDSDTDARILPRPIDNASPGVGINLNDAAADYAPGASVTLTGCYVAPKRIVDDAQYQLYAPSLAPFLLTLPFCSLEPETIFAPVEV
jgi:hypothetical protein